MTTYAVPLISLPECSKERKKESAPSACKKAFKTMHRAISGQSRKPPCGRRRAAANHSFQALVDALVGQALRAEKRRHNGERERKRKAGNDELQAVR